MNKRFFVAVNTGYFDNGLPTKECIDFYRERSGKGIYCSIIGNIVIKNGSPTNRYTGMINKDPIWNELSKTIEEGKSIPGIQLATTWPSYVGQRNFINNDWSNYVNEIRPVLHNININELFKKLSESIELSIENGFRHVQIHAAHGYLLSLLLDPFFYSETENVINELLSIKDMFESNIELSIRISAFCGLPKDQEIMRSKVLKQLYGRGFHFIDLSEGYYNFNKHFIYPSTYLQRKERTSRCNLIASEFPNQEYILSCYESDNPTLSPNVNIGYCRKIIANPEFIDTKKNLCNLCDECHYYSKGEKKLKCGSW